MNSTELKTSWKYRCPKIKKKKERTRKADDKNKNQQQTTTEQKVLPTKSNHLIDRHASPRGQAARSWKRQAPRVQTHGRSSTCLSLPTSTDEVQVPPTTPFFGTALGASGVVVPQPAPRLPKWRPARLLAPHANRQGLSSSLLRLRRPGQCGDNAFSGSTQGP